MALEDGFYLVARIGLAMLWLIAARGALHRAVQRKDRLAAAFAALLTMPAALSLLDVLDNLVLQADRPIAWSSWVWMAFDGLGPLFCLWMLRALAERDTAEAALRDLAETDMLTGLPNRRAFFDRAATAIGGASRRASPCAALLLDLDRFKAINDGWGHPAGDAVLRDLASTLRGTLRQADLPVRWGGEEFGALLPFTDAAEAMVLAERLRQAIRRGVPHPGGADHGPVTASIGVAGLDVTLPPAEALAAAMRSADVALYAAKAGGRDRVQLAMAG